ncbi:MAG TPA: hypothetical protein VMW52_12050, partial [Phycisphaerae bacterium]|nr:hypothetical protein [Phycisphaerae bacterium]
RTIPHDYEWDEEDAEVREDEAMLEAMGATPEQLYWRRRCIAEKCRGDVNVFRQEYPATAEQAFLSTGRPVFRRSIIQEHMRTARAGERIRFGYDPIKKDTITLQACEDFVDHYWEVWVHPVEGRDYMMGVDVAEGVEADPDRPQDDPDYSVALIMDRRTLETVARLRVRIDADIVGREIIKAAKYYNNAWIVPEANAVGQTVIGVLKDDGYPMVYQREKAQDSTIEGTKHLLGWKTTVANRDYMIDEYIAAVRSDKGNGFNGKFICYSENLALEEEMFVYTNRGRREARRGKHDDELFAAMLLWQGHRRLPREEALQMWPVWNPFDSPLYAGGYDREGEALIEHGLEPEEELVA